ncbi:hypothetical protein KZZ52_57860 [Dactylosporangium sp. AC04546]|uniref:hypothetical protein n=1 Tax=Dactylosporangium sp. AC04546 TaxID=2862460 RepID=UPI001EE0D13E|nr:hypothetical protein [Dactylosporangium sp. AC04546]WVK83470.1 hypothetical protein KZZ52_57860 [Dactylosporangium sp. AC04546]
MGRVVLAALLALALAACGRPALPTGRVENQADYPMYDNIQMLHERATLVVAGSVLSDEVRSIDGLAYTVYRVQVDRRFKGTSASLIDVKQVSAEAGGIPLRTGTRYVLFLETYPDSPASLLNPAQAQYVLRDGERPERVDPAGFEFTLASLEAL